VRAIDFDKLNLLGATGFRYGHCVAYSTNDRLGVAGFRYGHYVAYSTTEISI
jgi:hypothetical protein